MPDALGYINTITSFLCTKHYAFYYRTVIPTIPQHHYTTTSPRSGIPLRGIRPRAASGEFRQGAAKRQMLTSPAAATYESARRSLTFNQFTLKRIPGKKRRVFSGKILPTATSFNGIASAGFKIKKRNAASGKCKPFLRATSSTPRPFKKFKEQARHKEL